MTPIQKLVRASIRKYNKDNILVISDWCAERDMKKAAEDMRGGCTSQCMIQIERLYRMMFKATRLKKLDFSEWCDKEAKEKYFKEGHTKKSNAFQSLMKDVQRFL